MQAGDPLTREHLQAYAAAVAMQSPGTEAARLKELLAGVVRTQAYVQAYMDGLPLVAAIMAAALVPVALLRPASPTPSSPSRPGRTRAGPAGGGAA